MGWMHLQNDLCHCQVSSFNKHQLGPNEILVSVPFLREVLRAEWFYLISRRIFSSGSIRNRSRYPSLPELLLPQHVACFVYVSVSGRHQIHR